MAVPRPVLLALLGVALIASAFLATRGATSDQAVEAPPAPAPIPAPSAKKPDAASDASRASRPDPSGRDGRPAKKPDAPTGTPAEIIPVVRALGQKQVVVLFFTKAGAADDTGTRLAVDSLRGMKGVKVFSAGVEQLASYRPILSGVGVSQVPAVVVVRPGRHAQLVEGFIDEQSLRQRVADASR